MVKFIELLKIQDELNETITTNWKEVRTLRDLYIALKQEISEAIDSFPWKWWKVYETPQPDYDNLKLELVDILHFYLSMMLLHYKDSSLEEIVDIAFADIVDTDIDSDYVLLNKILKLDVTAYFACTVKQHEYFKALSFEFWNIVNYLTDTKTFLNLYLFKVALNHLRQELSYDEEYHKKFKESDIDNKIVIQLAKDIGVDDIDEAKTILKKNLLGV